jgi:hypothetical protein
MTELGPARAATAKRLAEAIRDAATEERHRRLADRAETGEFSDYSDAHACGITEAHRLCQQYGLGAIAQRLATGEFDATKEESDEWARSASGQDAAKQLSPALRKMLGLDLMN